jgi:hypothetical protein
MELSKEDHDALERLEEELWREETRFDSKRMNDIIAPDFFEFGRSGRICRRADTLAAPKRPMRAVFPLPDFGARLLDQDIAQVTYNSTVTYDRGVRYGGVRYGGVRYARRSSIWWRSPTGWVLRFHQGTPCSWNLCPAAGGNCRSHSCSWSQSAA